MAGDWIKITLNLTTKPEVFAIAKLVGQNRHEVVGRLVAIWTWADQTTTDGEQLALTSEDLDEIAGTGGFAAAMRSAGWLEGRDGSLQLPNFERHNGSSAKARALEQEAKRLRRLSDKTSDNMSDTCPTKQARKVRPEKRREEKSLVTTNVVTPPTPEVAAHLGEALKQSLADWLAYKAERGQRYKAKGLQAMHSRAASLAETHGEPAVVDAIQRAMANHWAGWDQASSFTDKATDHGQGPRNACSNAPLDLSGVYAMEAARNGGAR